MSLNKSVYLQDLSKIKCAENWNELGKLWNRTKVVRLIFGSERKTIYCSNQNPTGDGDSNEGRKKELHAHMIINSRKKNRMRKFEVI